MSQGRRHFTDEFKREAVALLGSSGRPLSRIASELGISTSMLRNWRNGSGGRHPIPASPPHSAPDPAAEITRLRRENDRLRTERDIFKKGCGHLLGTAEMRFGLIEDHRDIWRVRVMCEALSVSPSGYYAWRSRPDSLRKIANRALLVDIRRVRAQHRERYGAPHMRAELASPRSSLQSNGAVRERASSIIPIASQYATSEYRDILKAAAITQSMSRKANCWDNAPMESFFGTLKTELAHYREYPDRDTERRELFAHIEAYYNRARVHSTIGYITPQQAEAKTA